MRKKRLFFGLYRDDPRQPQPRKPPRPPAPPKTEGEKLADRLAKARTAKAAWERRLRMSSTYLKKWHRRVSLLERLIALGPEAIEAARIARAARAATRKGRRALRKITLEG